MLTQKWNCKTPRQRSWSGVFIDIKNKSTPIFMWHTKKHALYTQFGVLWSVYWISGGRAGFGKIVTPLMMTFSEQTGAEREDPTRWTNVSLEETWQCFYWRILGWFISSITYVSRTNSGSTCWLPVSTHRHLASLFPQIPFPSDIFPSHSHNSTQHYSITPWLWPLVKLK